MSDEYPLSHVTAFGSNIFRATISMRLLYPPTYDGKVNQVVFFLVSSHSLQTLLILSLLFCRRVSRNWYLQKTYFVLMGSIPHDVMLAKVQIDVYDLRNVFCAKVVFRLQEISQRYPVAACTHRRARWCCLAWIGTAMLSRLASPNNFTSLRESSACAAATPVGLSLGSRGNMYIDDPFPQGTVMYPVL